MITRGARDEGEEQEAGIQANFYVNEIKLSSNVDAVVRVYNKEQVKLQCAGHWPKSS